MNSGNSAAVAMLNMLGYEANLLENGMEAWDAAGGENAICAR